MMLGNVPILQRTGEPIVIMLVQEFFIDTLVCKALKTVSIVKMADVYLKSWNLTINSTTTTERG